jgi:Mrp family chromosome partitioning ATPase
MRVLLAVGNEKTAKEIAEHLINNGIEVKSCYNRIAVSAAAKEHRAEVVVLSPVLPGDEDLVADVVQPLWNDGIRIVLLPGGADLPDTRDLIKKVIPYRVYDFVYDPVTPEKVLERLNNPGLPADLPKDLVRAAMLEETVSETVPEAVPAEKGENRWGFLTKLAKKRRWKNAVQATETNARRRDGDAQKGNAAQSVPGGQQTAPTLLPEERSASSFREKELSQREKRTDASPVYPEKRERIPEDFAVLGSEEFPFMHELCAALPGDYTAVVVPADWPDLVDTIKELRREAAVSFLPIIVVGSCDAKECYAAGAEECVEDLGSETVERIRMKVARMREVLAEKEELRKKLQSALPAPGSKTAEIEAKNKTEGWVRESEDKKTEEIQISDANKDILTVSTSPEFIYEICPYKRSTSKESRTRDEEKTTALRGGSSEKKAPRDKKRELTAPQELGMYAKIIAVGSPWLPSGATTFSVVMAKFLAERKKVAAVDCDLTGRGLGMRFALNPVEIAGRDWRSFDAPVKASKVAVFPLDPSNREGVSEKRLTKIIGEAGRGVDWLVLDVGKDPDVWWFRCGVNCASVVLWVVRDDPLFVERARLNWKERPRVQCRELMVLFGPGDIREIEEIFVIPCLQVKGPEDKKGLRRLADFLEAVPNKRGPRALAVGVKNEALLAGYVVDYFETASEAKEWLRFNRPDVAFLSRTLKDLTLLEHDLKNQGVPARKV